MTQLIETLSGSAANLQFEGIGDSAQKTYYLEGIFIQGDKKNHNGRIYPRHEIERAVKLVNEKLEAGYNVLGEVDHPQNLQINLDRVSHALMGMRMNGSDGIGKLKIFHEMPMGRVCKVLLENGVKLGVSSRGTGEVDYQGYVKGFDIVTIDIVAQPSAPDAYPKAILETLDHYKRGNMIVDLAVASSTDSVAEKYLQKEIISFIEKLKI